MILVLGADPGNVAQASIPRRRRRRWRVALGILVGAAIWTGLVELVA